MPEVIEALMMSQELTQLKGYTILGIESTMDNSEALEEIKNQKIIEVFNKGKRVIIQLENGYLHSLLSMTGKWILPGLWNADVKLLSRILDFAKLIISYGITTSVQESNGFKIIKRIKGRLYFSDVRGFAKLNYLTHNQLVQELNTLGADVLQLSKDDCLNIFYNYRKCSRRICDFIVDQRIISGIGNYLRAEILYVAKLNPQKPVNLLTEQEIILLHQAIKGVLYEVYLYKGLSISHNASNYISPMGNTGNYYSKVYNRRQCPIGHQIAKLKGNQTLYYCPIEQV